MNKIITEKKEQLKSVKAEAYDLFAGFEFHQMKANEFKGLIDAQNNQIKTLTEEIQVLEAQSDHQADNILEADAIDQVSVI